MSIENKEDNPSRDWFTFYTKENISSEKIEEIDNIVMNGMTFQIASFEDISPQIQLQTKSSLYEISKDTLGSALYSRVATEYERLNNILEGEDILFSGQISIDEQRKINLLSLRNGNDQEYEEILSSIQQMKNKYGEKFRAPSNIIITATDEKRFDANLANGRYSYPTDSILLFPQAFNGEHRVSGVSNLTGTLFHEFGHLYINGHSSLSNEWYELGGWKRDQDGVPYTNMGEACVNDYARTLPEEDFCESLVASNVNPRLLQHVSSEKYRFINNFFGDFIGDSEGVEKPILESSGEPIIDLPNKLKYIVAQRSL